MIAPIIKPLTPGFDSYLKYIPEGPYVINQFASGSPLLCPLTTLTIEPVVGGSSLDYTGTDGVTLVSLLTGVTDTTISVSLPNINIVEKEYLFRIKAT